MHPEEDLIARRLGDIARRLGAAAPAAWLSELLDATFAAGAPARYDNALSPGALPIELSFSEVNPNTLRITVEPFGAAFSPGARRAGAIRLAQALVLRAFGEAAAERFARQLSNTDRAASAPRFGAFMGASMGLKGLDEIKIYEEVCPRVLPLLEGDLGRVARAIVETFPQATPHLLSSACSRGRLDERLYLVCDKDVRLLDLAPVAEQLGLAHRFPELLTTALDVTGGRFDLLRRSLILGVRASEGVEMKVELLHDALPSDPLERASRVERALVSRPASLHAYRRWLRAIAGEPPSSGEIVVVSLRITAGTSSRLNVYVRPAGRGLHRVWPRSAKGRGAIE